MGGSVLGHAWVGIQEVGRKIKVVAAHGGCSQRPGLSQKASNDRQCSDMAAGGGDLQASAVFRMDM